MEDAFSTLKRLYPSCRQNPKGFFENIPCPTCVTSRDRAKKKRFVYVRGLKSNCWVCETPLTWQELTGMSEMPKGAVTTRSDEPEKPPHPFAKKLPVNGQGIPVHLLPPEHPAVKVLNKDFIFNLEDVYNNYGVLYVPSDQGVVLMTNPLVTSAERLLFPVKQNNELVGWQMRAIPGTNLGDRHGCIKYYHLFNKGEHLYNYDNAKKYDTVIVTEGVKKAWKFPNAIATLGKGITDLQLQLLQEWSNIIFFYDGEDATQAKSADLVRQLSLGGYTAINIDPRKYGFPSPDEMTTEQALSIVTQEWESHHGT